jgi:hypothetical protein
MNHVRWIIWPGRRTSRQAVTSWKQCSPHDLSERSMSDPLTGDGEYPYVWYQPLPPTVEDGGVVVPSPTWDDAVSQVFVAGLPLLQPQAWGCHASQPMQELLLACIPANMGIAICMQAHTNCPSPPAHVKLPR